MPTVLYVRHGRSSANTAGTLAGWMPGVFLDDAGARQADAVGKRIADAGLTVRRIVSSPLDRCVQTGERIAAALGSVPRSVHAGLGECRYGAWTGRPLTELARDRLWRVVQDRPSEAAFPSSAAYPGESLVAMQTRALRAVREEDERVAHEHGPHAVWVAVSHGDVIKSLLAHAVGAHLDEFQRIQVDPGSVSVVHYTSHRPLVLRVNDTGGDLAGLRPPEAESGAAGDGVVGGGSGTVG
ncbi:MSMEG_4193 family putative phosphomutase [Intrasporangium sp.]|uniref:MSMEG_4193 family putative phosphomutase n=1 Tax=Intrasporangium sp. TaxID=1925024 RepID=UPI003221D470